MQTGVIATFLLVLTGMTVFERIIPALFPQRTACREAIKYQQQLMAQIRAVQARAEAGSGGGWWRENGHRTVPDINQRLELLVCAKQGYAAKTRQLHTRGSSEARLLANICPWDVPALSARYLRTTDELYWHYGPPWHECLGSYIDDRNPVNALYSVAVLTLILERWSGYLQGTCGGSYTATSGYTRVIVPQMHRHLDALELHYEATLQALAS